MNKITIIDSTLRDGMHAVRHFFSLDDMVEIAAGLDVAGVKIIEVSHGEGIGGSSFQYGFSKYTDLEYIAAVSEAVKTTQIAILLLPGIGLRKDLEKVAKYNVKIARIATHVTEADIGIQHIKIAKELDMFAIGFLMMAHMVIPSKVAEQASIFAEAGADAVYVTDSAGTMMPHEVKERILAVKQATGLPVGFHGHNNLGLSIGNSLMAVESGALFVDGTTRGLGAGAGNAPTEVLASVLDKNKYATGIDLYEIMNVADDIVAPKMMRPLVIDKNTLSIGYAGTYGSFLLHAIEAAKKFNVDARDILMEMGRRKSVGGQEDLIIDVAYELGKQKVK